MTNEERKLRGMYGRDAAKVERPPELRCLDANRGGCSGAVEHRLALSPSGRSFPRCDRHWQLRLDEQERIIDRVGNPDSDVPPAWFDPLAAGERWDDDY